MSLPEVGQIVVPTFVTLPADLSRSPQLDALTARDTADLPPPLEEVADPSLLPAALAALRAMPDAPTLLTGLSIYNDRVYFSYEDRGISGRSVTVIYRGPDDVYVADPTYNDEPTFAVDLVDDAVPAALVDALAKRVPNAIVSSIDLGVSGSYGFRLVWNLRLEDARGSSATVFADLDGAIIAVDES